VCCAATRPVALRHTSLKSQGALFTSKATMPLMILKVGKVDEQPSSFHISPLVGPKDLRPSLFGKVSLLAGARVARPRELPFRGRVRAPDCRASAKDRASTASPHLVRRRLRERRKESFYPSEKGAATLLRGGPSVLADLFLGECVTTGDVVKQASVVSGMDGECLLGHVSPGQGMNPLGRKNHITVPRYSRIVKTTLKCLVVGKFNSTDSMALVQRGR